MIFLTDFLTLIFYRVPRLLIIIFFRVFSFYNSKLYINKSNTTNKSSEILFNLVELCHGQSHQFFALARSLRNDGHNVSFLLCDSFLPRCEIRSLRNSIYPCLECRSFSQVLPRLFNIKVYKYSDLINKPSIKKHDLTLFKNNPKINNICHESIVRYYYGDPPNLNSLQYEEDYESEVFSAYISYLAIKKLHTITNFNIIVSNMFVYSIWGSHYLYSLESNIRYKVISSTAYSKNSVVLDRHKMYENNLRFLSWHNSREKRSLTIDENLMLNNFLKMRIDGADPILKKFSFKNKFHSLEELIDINKKNICFYSNIYWDIGLVKYGAIFDDVIDWLYESIMILDNEDPMNVKYNILIKVHPAELLDSVKSQLGIREILRSKLQINIYSRIRFISPHDGISPYSLAKLCNLNVVYNGTIGLELLCLGFKNILIGGPAPYRFISNQNLISKDHYSKMLRCNVDIPFFDFNKLLTYGFFYFIGECVKWPFTSNSYGTSLFNYISDDNMNLLSSNNSTKIKEWILYD